MTHHNTTHETGTRLAEYTSKAQSQEDKVLELFKRQDRPMSPWEVWEYFPNWPPTSARRAITNLTHSGLLEKTNIKRTGLYGRPEYFWRLP